MTFYENDQPVPVTLPSFGEPEEPRDDDRQIRLETAIALMRFFAESDESPRDIGRRLLCLLFIAGKGDISTQKELAKRLGVTPARVCQLLAKLNVRDLMKAPQTLSNSDARH